MKPVSGFFATLRARRDERELEKARRESFEGGRRHAEIIGRVESTKAPLAKVLRIREPSEPV
jgi:hypothetical protein